MSRGRNGMAARFAKILDLCTPVELARLESEVVRGALEQLTEAGHQPHPEHELKEIALRVAMLPPDDQASYHELVDAAHEARALALAAGPAVGGAAITLTTAQLGRQGWQHTADLAGVMSQLSTALRTLLEAGTAPTAEGTEHAEFMATLMSLAPMLRALEAQAHAHVAHLDSVTVAMTEAPTHAAASCLKNLDEIRDKLGGVDTVPQAWREQVEEGLAILRQARTRSA